MKLTLVRHGETEENFRKIIQGQLPGKLTEHGRQQAQEAAKQLKGRAFDVIYCSDLQRCLDTAEPIRAQYADILFVTDTLLRERKGGSSEGKSLAIEKEIRSHPDWYMYRPPDGGESWEDVRARQIPLLNKLFEQYADKSVLIVTHGGPLRGIRSLLEGKPLAEIDAEPTPNAGIWELTMTERLHV